MSFLFTHCVYAFFDLLIQNHLRKIAFLQVTLFEDFSSFCFFVPFVKSSRKPFFPKYLRDLRNMSNFVPDKTAFFRKRSSQELRNRDGTQIICELSATYNLLTFRTIDNMNLKNTAICHRKFMALAIFWPSRLKYLYLKGKSHFKEEHLSQITD